MKKKVTLVLFIVSLVISSFIAYENLFIGSNRFGAFFKMFMWVSTICLLVYYLKQDGTPQLVPSSILMEKKSDDSNNENGKSNVSFDDVAGLEEIKEELHEIIDFINHTEKYRKMGAKIPKGILFYGPPGTGKTLLAKAVAGETNSFFIYSSGSEFVEKYVGVGAKRIRNLYEKAKKNAPSIIFIDELDAIGCKRNLDSNNEKDQTLNQLLVEMDGFNDNSNIVVIGATNRLDLLDEALLRPGRFDRHIYVGNPNSKAREEIFKVHMKNKPIDASVKIKDLSKKTHGFSGAQLANIANEAAILAVRHNKHKIDIVDFNAAIERVVAGLEVKHPTILEKEKRIVAYHESGHALIGRILSVDMIQKISIIPRGQALGYVLKFPDEERYLHTESDLVSKIKVLLGGRAAEKIIYNEVTTGAKDDLVKASEIAEKMVCEYGMSSIGNIAIKDKYKYYNRKKIEDEIKKIIDSSYKDALNIINNNLKLLHEISAYLLEHETMDSEQLETIFAKEKRDVFNTAT
ncbi:ATP-dependent zinc metalloprotease FtsH [Clostridiaceae bacterium M8S5]|nr:ATP-dependent zinc metalloprotease FtsH [Clostridiaceae bacterium M8S5]